MPARRTAADALVDALLEASRALVAVATRSLAEAPAELTLPQFRALVVLSSRGPSSVQALTDRVGVHQSNVTRMVEKMEQAGYVTRGKDDRDRRLTVVSLTPEGERLVGRVFERRRALIARVVEDLPPGLQAEGRDGAVAVLRAFAERVDGDDDLGAATG